MLATVAVLLFASVSSLARPVHDDSAHEKSTSLLSTLGARDWAHHPSHPVHNLFRRQNNNLTVGSDQWIAQYPGNKLNTTSMPQAWKDALANAEAQGLIPNITISNNGDYPSGSNPGGPEICSAAQQCRGEGDIWDAPDGMIGIGFDDGPTTASPQLYEYLRNNSQKATHFFIGENIRDNAQIFLQAFNQGDDIAIHTWTHPFMSGKTNDEIVAELGWTAQIISDLTGGRVPRYWRPPYGDSDNRVRAIAVHIFGLSQVDWNQDTDDWELPEGKTSQAKISKLFSKWLTGPKSPGLIILEHELYPSTVAAFMAAYPNFTVNGWTPKSIPDMFGVSYYQNAMDDTSDVVPLNFINAGQTSVDLSGTATASTASASGTGGSGGSGGSGSGSSNAAVTSHAAPGVLVTLAIGLVSVLFL